MKKIIRLSTIVLFLLTLTIASCKTTDEEGQPVVTCDYKGKIAYKWYNTYTTTDTYSDAARTTKTGTVITSPVGFLKVNPNGNYEIVSDAVAEIGSWKIDTENCKLILDDIAVTSVVIDYDILSLANNNLIIKRIDGNKVITTHYKSASCASTAQLAQQWDNTKTYFFEYNPSTNLFRYPYLDFPYGYFKLNTNATYNVMSGGVPLNGTWNQGEQYCTLDLDMGTPIARSFEIVKITTDSLVIWRKDASTAKAYLQYYTKH